jgi:hypothetical protein
VFGLPGANARGGRGIDDAGRLPLTDPGRGRLVHQKPDRRRPARGCSAAAAFVAAIAGENVCTRKPAASGSRRDDSDTVN